MLKDPQKNILSCPPTVTLTEREDKDSNKGLSPGRGQDEGSFFIPSATLHEHEGLSVRLLRTATRRASCWEGRRQPRGVGPLLREGQGTDCHISSRRTLVLEGDDTVLALYLVFCQWLALSGEEASYFSCPSYEHHGPNQFHAVTRAWGEQFE